MARRNRRYRNNGMPGGFVALPKYMRESLAWRTLKPVPRTAFVELAGLYNGVNNGWLAMSARTLATAINVSRATAARALMELTERGSSNRLGAAPSPASSAWHQIDPPPLRQDGRPPIQSLHEVAA
jgi:hypothetical protein